MLPDENTAANLAPDAPTKPTTVSDAQTAAPTKPVTPRSTLDAIRDLLAFPPLEVTEHHPFDRGALQRLTPFLNVPHDASARLKLVEALAREPALDRAMGALVGLAMGDSCGAPLEFLDVAESGCGCSAFSASDLSYVNPFNRFQLKPGQWTDDSAMALCLADSLLARGGFDGSDVRVRFWSWWFGGYNNAFRKEPERLGSVGLGGNISQSLYSMRAGEVPTAAYEASGEDSGNGSIMRLAPVAIFCSGGGGGLAAAREMAAASSRTTHPGPIAAECCAFLAHLLVRAMTGFDATAGAGAARRFVEGVADEYLGVLSQRRDDEPAVAEMRRLLRAAEPGDSSERCWNWRAPQLGLQETLRCRGRSYNGYPVSAGYFGSYAPDAIAIALHAVVNSDSFDGAIERCVNCLGDADSTGAVCGQVAGAMYGWSAIGAPLRAALHEWDDAEIALRAALLATGAPPPVAVE